MDKKKEITMDKKKEITTDKKKAISEQTRQKLKETFLELYANDGMSNLTVGAITKKAGYNRCTFYNYYEDLQSMLCEIEDTVIEQIQMKMLYAFADGLPEDISSAFSLTLSVFEEYGNTIYILLGKNADAGFRAKLRKAAKDHFRGILKDQVSAEQLEYVLTFVTSAGLGLIEHWYETDKGYTTEEFLRLSQSLIAGGVLGQMKKKVR